VASCFTSSITGKAPVPVPMTSWRHFQGMASFGQIGVWPNVSRNFLDGFFLRLRTSPRSITTTSEKTAYPFAVYPTAMHSETGEGSGSAVPRVISYFRSTMSLNVPGFSNLEGSEKTRLGAGTRANSPVTHPLP